MDYAVLFPSIHLTAADLNGKEFTGTIERLERDVEVVSPTGQRAKKTLLWFKGAKKGWVLNKTNAGKIARILQERDVDKWPGGKITIGPATCRAFGEEDAPCIRVK